MSNEKKEDILHRESAFHDRWAQSEDINSIDVRNLFENLAAMENKFIVGHMGGLDNRKILDIGCGLGESSVYFALKGAKVTAIDISPQMIYFAEKLAQRYGVDIEFIVSSAEELPIKDRSFDFIYCANLLHHLPRADRLAFLKTVHALLNTDGWFYSWDPLKYNPAINVYRMLAKEVRSADEKPLGFKDTRDFEKVFARVWHKEFWLTTLLIFLKYYFIDRYNPNQTRYWKQIYREQEADIGWWFNVLNKIDDICLKLPFVRRLAWNMVVYAQK